MINFKYISPVIALMFIGCTSQSNVSPSQNQSLQAVSPSKTDNANGSLQKSLNSWIDEEWTPTLEKNETIQEINEDKSRDFKLQEYVDKMNVYMNESNASQKEAHHEKINTLPVIGK